MNLTRAAMTENMSICRIDTKSGTMSRRLHVCERTLADETGAEYLSESAGTWDTGYWSVDENHDSAGNSKTSCVLNVFGI